MPDRPSWPTDPKDRIRVREAEKTGDPFLVYRDEDGVQRIVRLAGEQRLAVVGRAASSDVPIE